VNELLDWEWRWLPSVMLIAAGSLLLLLGIAQGSRGARMPITTAGKNLLWMRGFRGAIQGGCILAAGVGWWAGMPVVVAAAGIIILEETIETGIATWALRQEFEVDRWRS
jgi:hypothetical protein